MRWVRTATAPKPSTPCSACRRPCTWLGSYGSRSTATGRPSAWPIRGPPSAPTARRSERSWPRIHRMPAPWPIQQGRSPCRGHARPFRPVRLACIGRSANLAWRRPMRRGATSSLLGAGLALTLGLAGPGEAAMRIQAGYIRTDQVGYELGGTARAFLITSQPATGATFKVEDRAGEVVLRGSVGCAGRALGRLRRHPARPHGPGRGTLYGERRGRRRPTGARRRR